MPNLTPSGENSGTVSHSRIQRAWTWLKRLGPVAIAQAEVVSSRVAQHHARMLAAEAIKEAYVAEATTVAEVKAKILIELANERDAIRRVQLASTLDQADRHLRTVTIQQAALTYLAKLPSSETERTQQQDVNAHWFDTFLQLSRQRNEDWRMDLLARALARETGVPGSVDSKTLWAIGTMSEKTFHAFSHFIDAAVMFNGDPALPFRPGGYGYEHVPDCLLTDSPPQYGFVVPILEEEGLVTTNQTYSKICKTGVIETVKYCRHEARVTFHNEYHIRGVLTTRLGRQLSDFYEQKQVPFGERNYEEVMSELAKQHSIEKIST